MSKGIFLWSIILSRKDDMNWIKQPCQVKDEIFRIKENKVTKLKERTWACTREFEDKTSYIQLQMSSQWHKENDGEDNHFGPIIFRTFWPYKSRFLLGRMLDSWFFSLYSRELITFSEV